MGVVDRHQVPATERCSERTRAAVEQLFRDGNRDALVGELRSRVSQSEAEDLIHRSVERALSGRCKAEHVAGVHAWIRQDIRFALSNLHSHQQVVRRKLYEAANALPRPGETPGPERGIAQQGNVDLAERLLSDFSQQDQAILRLAWGEDEKRKVVASTLGVSERVVKRTLSKSGRRLEDRLVRHLGGGCGADDEDIVRAHAFNRAGDTDGARAVLHMHRCERCRELHERVGQIRLGVAALTPVPFVAKVSMPDRAAARFGDALSWVRDQATAASVRAHELAAAPPPMKPGAMLASIGVCAAAAGGSYCLEQVAPPLRDLTNAADVRPEKPATEPDPEAAAPVDPAQLTPSVPLPTEPVTPADPEPGQQSDAEAKAKAKAKEKAKAESGTEAETQAAEASAPATQPNNDIDFEASAPSAPSAPAASASTPQPTPAPRPAPAPSTSGPEFP